MNNNNVDSSDSTSNKSDHEKNVENPNSSIDQIIRNSNEIKKTEKKDSFSFGSIISLRIHGSELLTISAKVWMAITSVLVFIMASAEAFSWGFLSQLLFLGEFKYVVAIIVGIIIFVIVWSADVTLMTLDRSKSYHEKIFGEGEAKKDWSWLKDVGGVIFRTLIVTFSLAVTAPFLSQLFYNTPIENEIERETNEVISKKRSSLDKEWKTEIINLSKKIEDYQKQLEDEIAGRRKSSLYGDGPVAKAIREKIKQNQEELGVLKTTPPKNITRFDSLVLKNNLDLVSKEFGIILPKNDIQQRSIIVAKILATGTVKDTEIAIRAFLLFLFLTLALLKIFEPRGTRVYYSEALHQAWKGYKTGTYDKWVPIDERWGGRSPMEPYRFEDFIINTYAKQRQNDEADKRDDLFDEARQTVSDIIASLQKELDREIERIKPILEPLFSDIDKINKDLEEKNGILIETKYKIEEKNQLINRFNEKLKDLIGSYTNFKSQNSSPEDLEIARKISETINATKNSLSLENEYLKSLKTLNDKEAIEVEALKDRKRRIETSIHMIKSTAVKIEKSMVDINDDAVDAYKLRAQQILNRIKNNGSETI